MFGIKNHTLGNTLIEHERAADARAVTRSQLVERYLSTPAGRLDSLALWWAVGTLALCTSLFGIVSSVRLALLW